MFDPDGNYGEEQERKDKKIYTGGLSRKGVKGLTGVVLMGSLGRLGPSLRPTAF